jgi:hypothetical protein
MERYLAYAAPRPLLRKQRSRRSTMMWIWRVAQLKRRQNSLPKWERSDPEHFSMLQAGEVAKL